jgi:site-specific recombinase XerD
LSVLIDHAITYSKNNHRDKKNFIIRAEVWRKDFGDRPADSLKPAVFSEWLEDQMEQWEWSPATFNRYKACLSTIYRLAMQNSHVTANPARLIPQKRESRGRIRFLTEEEEESLRKKILANRPHCIEQFYIALNTGMRKGEQFSIEWTQFDSKNASIHLDTTKNGSDRYVHLNATALSAFEKLRKEKPSRYEGKVFSIKDPKEWFAVSCEEAKVYGVTWHILRHTFASRLVMKNVNLRTVQELMGHKTLAMTARYAHLAPSYLREAVATLVAESKPLTEEAA